MASVEEVDPSDYSWPWKDMDIFLQKLPRTLQQFFWIGKYEVPNQKTIFVCCLLREKDLRYEPRLPTMWLNVI